MKELGWDMIQIWQGYKANRRPGYCEKYRIVEHETGRVIREEVTIYQIQKAFAHEEVPLEDKQTEKYQREKLLIAAGEKEEWKQRPVNEKVWNPAAREFYMKYIEEDPTTRSREQKKYETGIKGKKKRTTKEKVRGLIRSIPDKPFSERKSQISTPNVTYRKVKQ